MKVYYIYLSDDTGDPLIGRWKNKKEARAAGQLYIRQWQLSAKITKIESKIIK